MPVSKAVVVLGHLLTAASNKIIVSERSFKEHGICNDAPKYDFQEGRHLGASAWFLRMENRESWAMFFPADELTRSCNPECAYQIDLYITELNYDTDIHINLNDDLAEIKRKVDQVFEWIKHPRDLF